MDFVGQIGKILNCSLFLYYLLNLKQLHYLILITCINTRLIISFTQTTRYTKFNLLVRLVLAIIKNS